MGRVTLYMSMVLMMMAGVVRKKNRKKRKVLIAIKRVHQLKRRMDRCFLGAGGTRGAHLGRERLHREGAGTGERKQYFFLYANCGPGPMCRGRWDFSLGTSFAKAQTTSQRLQ